MGWITKLERKYRRYGIPNLMRIIAIGMGAVLVGTLLWRDLYGMLTLNWAAVMRGQVWRLVTFLFVPPAGSLVWMVVLIYCFFSIGSVVESRMSTFRFTLYYLFSTLGCILVAALFGYAENTQINFSLFLAFAALMPDEQVMFFFVLPVKAKWLGWAYLGLQAYNIIKAFRVSARAGIVGLVTLAVILAIFCVFFGSQMLQSFRESQQIRQNRRNWRR